MYRNRKSQFKILVKISNFTVYKLQNIKKIDFAENMLRKVLENFTLYIFLLIKIIL